MAKTTSPFTLRAHLLVGVVILGSSAVIAANSPTLPSSNISSPTSSSSSLISATTTPVPVVTTNPASEYGHFNVSVGNNTCVLLDISCIVSLELNNTSGVQTVMFALPMNAFSSGMCAGDSSSISLAWTQGSVNLTLTLAFKMSSDKWQSSSVSFTATNVNHLKPIIINGTERSVTERFDDATFMSAAKGKSYKCEKAKDVAKGSVTVTFNKIQVQPFGGEFGEAEVCTAKSGTNPAEPVDTVVPIAVGCVLLSLIIILIITYFVGRCRRTGYQSM